MNLFLFVEIGVHIYVLDFFIRYEAGYSTMTVALSTPVVKSSHLLRIPQGISDISSRESGKQATDR